MTPKTILKPVLVSFRVYAYISVLVSIKVYAYVSVLVSIRV